MIEARKYAKTPYISTTLPGRYDWWMGLSVALVSILVFIGVGPSAHLQLAPSTAFLPAYQSVVIINDAITFVILLGQYDILRSRGLFVIACGYLFNAAMAAFHGVWLSA